MVNTAVITTHHDCFCPWLSNQPCEKQYSFKEEFNMAKATTATTTAVQTLTIEEAKDLARIFQKEDIPTYFHSAPGVGKSDIMKQLAAEQGIGFKDIRVGTMLPEDLTGIPVPDLERRVATWLRAEFWPEKGKDGPQGIIAFDELSDAN